MTVPLHTHLALFKQVPNTRLIYIIVIFAPHFHKIIIMQPILILLKKKFNKNEIKMSLKI